jgi:hypothetical protein
MQKKIFRTFLFATFLAILFQTTVKAGELTFENSSPKLKRMSVTIYLLGAGTDTQHRLTSNNSLHMQIADVKEGKTSRDISIVQHPSSQIKEWEDYVRSQKQNRTISVSGLAWPAEWNASPDTQNPDYHTAPEKTHTFSDSEVEQEGFMLKFLNSILLKDSSDGLEIILPGSAA